MKFRNKPFLLLLGFFLMAVPSIRAEEIAERLDGQVAGVDAEKRILTVEFVHPATDQQTEKTFMILENASFQNLKALSDLQKGDLVTVDYYEHKNGAEAVYITRVLVDKSYVSHSELAGALLQLKKNK